MAKFLIHESIQTRLQSADKALSSGLTAASSSASESTTSSSSRQLDDSVSKLDNLNNTNGSSNSADYFELDKVYLGNPLEQYYLIPYNLSKLTFFVFIRVNDEFQLSLLRQIDDILGGHMLAFMQEIAEQQARRNLIK